MYLMHMSPLRAEAICKACAVHWTNAFNLLFNTDVGMIAHGQDPKEYYVTSFLTFETPYVPEDEPVEDVND